MLELPTEPTCAESHFGHARGIIDLFLVMDEQRLAETWANSGSMALYSAQRHVDALYKICRKAEIECAKLRDEVELLKKQPA